MLFGDEETRYRKAVRALRNEPDYWKDFFSKIQELSNYHSKYFPDMFQSFIILDQIFKSRYPIKFCREMLARLFPCVESTYDNKLSWLKWFRYCGFVSNSNIKKPDTPIILWRGGRSEKTKEGLSWTSDKKCAEWFAARERHAYLDIGEPVLFRAVAGPDAILASFSEKGEGEYVVDPDMLVEVEALIPDCKQFTEGLFNVDGSCTKDIITRVAVYKEVKEIMKEQSYLKLIETDLNLKNILGELGKIKKWLYETNHLLCQLDKIVEIINIKKIGKILDDYYPEETTYALTSNDDEKGSFIKMRKQCQKEIKIASKKQDQILTDLQLLLGNNYPDCLDIYYFCKSILWCSPYIEVKQYFFNEISIPEDTNIEIIKEQYKYITKQIDDRFFLLFS